MKSSALKLFLLLFGLIVSASATAYDFQSGGLYYRITSSTDKTVAVTYKTRDQDSGYSGAITIPSNVTYSGTSYSVTSIDGEAFKNNKSLTSITIPASIEIIGKDAFYHCTSLSTVRLLDGGPIKLIAYYNDWDGYNVYLSMFYSCPITYFYFGRTNVSSSWIYADGDNDYYSSPNALREAFSRVETLVIGANVSEETIHSFPKVNSSANITISGNNPSLKSKGNIIYSQDEKTLIRYWGNDDLFIPQTVTAIANGAFRDCESAIIELPSSITSIGSLTFSGCRNLSYIALPAVINIGSSAFQNCIGLASINMPAVTSISEHAFSGCTSLTSVTMPAVTSIGNKAFSSSYEYSPYYKEIPACTALSSVTMPAVISIGRAAFSGCTRLTSVELPSSLTSISDYAFYGCTSLTSLDMPAATSIGERAFFLCTSLTSLDMPAVTSISGYAFSSDSYYDDYDNEYYVPACTGLTSINLPAATSIGFSAFEDCSRLTSVELPASVASIGSDAFRSCNIKSVRVNREDLSDNSILHKYLPSNANWEYYINGELVTTHFKVPEGTEKLGNGLFYNARNLTSVELPSSLTSISSSAFQGCTGLTSVELPSSLTSIESSAFQDCTGLTTVEMPAVTTIGTSAFQGCTHLTSMEMPVVTTIGSSAFQSCTGLTSMEMPVVTNVESSAFQGCTHLTSVEMPAVTTIGSSAFQNTSLKQIDIPACITSIDKDAFAGTAPTAFICRATTPPSLGTGNNFGGKQKLYVPYESVGEYEKKWALGSNYDYLPLLDVMFFEKTDKAAYQAALSGKTKNGITSVAFYDGGIGDDLTESILKRGMNPNCLYFLPDEAGLKGDNIISLNDYTADYVALTDAYAYECPIPFRVNVIEYQHNPSVWATGHSGWETLCLPFAASEYEGSESGTLFPIILGSSGNFWLRRYVGSSANNVYFSSTYDGQMEANTPYLVAFPGSTMGDGHLEGQTITFRGYGIDLPVTKAPELHKNDFIFTGNYDKTPDGVTGWALNTEGSSFVQSSTVGNDPFRGYFKHKDATTGSNQLKISFGTFDETTGIFTPELNVEDSAASQNIYDLQGRRTTDSQQGVSIKNGKKHLSL